VVFDFAALYRLSETVRSSLALAHLIIDGLSIRAKVDDAECCQTAREHMQSPATKT